MLTKSRVLIVFSQTLTTPLTSTFCWAFSKLTTLVYKHLQSFICKYAVPSSQYIILCWTIPFTVILGFKCIGWYRTIKVVFLIHSHQDYNLCYNLINSSVSVILPSILQRWAMVPPSIIALIISAAILSKRSAPRAAQSPTLSPTLNLGIYEVSIRHINTTYR